MERDPDTKERFTSIPIKVETHSDIKYVAAKFSRTLIVKNDGTVWLYSLPPINTSSDAEYMPWEIKGFGI